MFLPAGPTPIAGMSTASGGGDAGISEPVGSIQGDGQCWRLPFADLALSTGESRLSGVRGEL